METEYRDTSEFSVDIVPQFGKITPQEDDDFSFFGLDEVRYIVTLTPSQQTIDSPLTAHNAKII